MSYYFSNEIVFRGHPDKVCDQISAAILQELLSKDPDTRAGIEVTGSKHYIFISGEITTKAEYDVKCIAYDTLRRIGYNPDEYSILVDIVEQSEDIAQGVNTGGAGDQGMMFGYACNDTEELLPTAMVILQRLSRAYDDLRRKYPEYIYADGKAQITGLYDNNQKLIKIKDLVISYNNCETNRAITDQLLWETALDIINSYDIPIENIHINPTGAFKLGGFEADVGVTGRKIVVDAYHSFANVGGGCMNGKDPSKVDFSAAHKARQLAVRYLEKENLSWCEVQISYAIGIAKPLAIYITSNKGEFKATEDEYVECEPNNIIKDLNLKHFDYVDAAAFGHFQESYFKYIK